MCHLCHIVCVCVRVLLYPDMCYIYIRVYKYIINIFTYIVNIVLYILYIFTCVHIACVCGCRYCMMQIDVAVHNVDVDPGQASS